MTGHKYKAIVSTHCYPPTVGIELIISRQFRPEAVLNKCLHPATSHILLDNSEWIFGTHKPNTPINPWDTIYHHHVWLTLYCFPLLFFFSSFLIIGSHIIFIFIFCSSGHCSPTHVLLLLVILFSSVLHLSEDGITGSACYSLALVPGCGWYNLLPWFRGGG